MIHQGDALAVLRKMRANTFHGCLTDPPYGLSFMGEAWDAGVPGPETWREVLRVLKPGAFLLAFGGTRTYHRLACAIEDAGFEIRDSMMWLYGSGFPKSHDISKGLDKRRDWPALDRFHASVRTARLKLGISQSEAARRCGIIGPDERLAGGGFMWYETGRRTPTGAQYKRLKAALNLTGECDEAFEQVAREITGTVQEWKNRSNYALTSVDGFRRDNPATDAARAWKGYGTALKPAYEPIIVAMKPCDGTFAQNAQRHGVAGLAIDAARIGDGRRWPANVILDEEAAAALDAQTGILTSGNNPAKRSPDKHRNVYGGLIGDHCLVRRATVSGGASRFFYCAKASKRERAGNPHPCVKPLSLNQYLARLILPATPGARLLVPFCGSGSEMLGAKRAGWKRIDGIERDPAHAALAARRLAA